MYGIEILKGFFNQEFLRSIIGALIGTGTSLFVFYLTIRSEKKSEKKKIEEDSKNRIRHFVNLIESSIDHIEQNISSLDTMITGYNNNAIDSQSFNTSASKSLNRLDELLKNENYFLSYVNIFGQQKIKNFNSISKEVDYFNAQVEYLWCLVKKAQRADYERKNKFKDQVNDLLNLTALLTTRKDLLSPEDIEKLRSYMGEFYKNEIDETDLCCFYEFIRKVLEDVLIKYRGTEEIQYFLPKYKEASILFKEIGSQNNNHKEELIKISEGLKTVLKKYKEDTSELINFNE